MKHAAVKVRHAGKVPCRSRNSRYIVDGSWRFRVEGTMAAGPEMRVGHAEREAVAAELREHYASGRITLEELNERLDKAFAAKTRSDLNALMTDLPSVRPLSAGTGGWSA